VPRGGCLAALACVRARVPRPATGAVGCAPPGAQRHVVCAHSLTDAKAGHAEVLGKSAGNVDVVSQEVVVVRRELAADLGDGGEGLARKDGVAVDLVGQDVQLALARPREAHPQRLLAVNFSSRIAGAA
jgi:hypothetical protein